MITQERLKELLHYDPNTGIFNWKIYRSHNAKAGDVAGCVHTCTAGKSYIIISIDSKNYKAHRLAFLYVRGEFPNQVDHLNGDGADNRLCNLRPANSRINAKNHKLRHDNSSGLAGVYWVKNLGKWRAQITSKPRIHLGYFYSLFEAACVRKSAEKEYGFHKNHGRIVNG